MTIKFAFGSTEIMKPESLLLSNDPSSERYLDELLTVEELAALLKVPKSWIYNHTRKRGIAKLPHIKIGKYLRFIESEVWVFLERQKCA